MKEFFGFAATLLFITSNLPMVMKALRTRDLHSYSLPYLIMNNVGNLLYWVYVVSIPFGPIWLLHGFNTIITAIMLTCYIAFDQCVGR